MNVTVTRSPHGKTKIIFTFTPPRSTTTREFYDCEKNCWAYETTAEPETRTKRPRRYRPDAPQTTHQ